MDRLLQRWMKAEYDRTAASCSCGGEQGSIDQAEERGSTPNARISINTTLGVAARYMYVRIRWREGFELYRIRVRRDSLGYLKVIAEVCFVY